MVGGAARAGPYVLRPSSYVLNYDFRQGSHPGAAPILGLSPMTSRDDYRRLLRSGGVAIWAAVGLPVLVFQLSQPPTLREGLPLAAWTASFLLFGAAFWLGTSRRRGESQRAGTLALVAGQTAAVLSLVALPPCFGLEGALLVLVALELGGLLPRRAAVMWIAVQS